MWHVLKKTKKHILISVLKCFIANTKSSWYTIQERLTYTTTHPSCLQMGVWRLRFHTSPETWGWCQQGSSFALVYFLLLSPKLVRSHSQARGISQMWGVWSTQFPFGDRIGERQNHWRQWGCVQATVRGGGGTCWRNWSAHLFSPGIHPVIFFFPNRTALVFFCLSSASSSVVLIVLISSLSVAWGVSVVIKVINK